MLCTRRKLPSCRLTKGSLAHWNHSCSPSFFCSFFFHCYGPRLGDPRIHPGRRQGADLRVNDAWGLTKCQRHQIMLQRMLPQCLVLSLDTVVRTCFLLRMRIRASKNGPSVFFVGACANSMSMPQKPATEADPKQLARWRGGWLERRRKKARGSARSHCRGRLRSIQVHFPSTASSAQLCLLCCQPEPVPGSSAARVRRPPPLQPCRLLAWKGQTISTKRRSCGGATLLRTPVCECDREKSLP